VATAPLTGFDRVAGNHPVPLSGRALADVPRSRRVNEQAEDRSAGIVREHNERRAGERNQ
jgi:hypothetical protein